MEIAIIILAGVCVLLALLLLNNRKMSEQFSNDKAELIRVNMLLKEENVKLAGRVEYAERIAAQSRADAEKRIDESMRQSRAILEQSESRFRLLANELLSTHASRLNQSNQSGLGQLLNPLKDDIEKFRRDVINFYSREAAERISLQERIKELVDTDQYQYWKGGT